MIFHLGMAGSYSRSGPYDRDVHAHKTRAIRLLLVAGCCVAAAVWASGPGRPADRLRAAGTGGLLALSVPLDWSGHRAGHVSLQVEVHRPAGHSRGVIFMLAGGPGQASAEPFYVGIYGPWEQLFRGYTLVAFDPRGTGGSDPISCRRTATPSPVEAGSTVAACARQIGPDRNFYGTADNVRDIDAVRRALGFQTIDLYGVSYGTDVALAYARTFPHTVGRLLLDSVASPVTAQPVLTDVLQEIPGTLRRFCAGSCAGITPDYAGEVVSLANALAAKPLVGPCAGAGGGTHVERLSGVAVPRPRDRDRSRPGSRSRAAGGRARREPRRSRAAPAPGRARRRTAADHKLDAVYLATSCDDGPFPWQPRHAGRPTEGTSGERARAAPGGSFGPFGSWAEGLGNTSDCLGWPVSPVPAPSTTAPYPDVRVLALSGDLDLRSPGVEARAALAQFHRGQLLTVTNTGHSVTSPISSCVTGQCSAGCMATPSRRRAGMRASSRLSP